MYLFLHRYKSYMVFALPTLPKYQENSTVPLKEESENLADYF